MRKWIALVALGLLMVVADAASADPWTFNSDGTGDSVGVVAPGQTVYVDTNRSGTGGAASSAVNVSRCSTITIIVFGTSASVMPEACLTSACTSNEDLISTALTGDTTNRYMASVVPFTYVRVDTSSDVIVSLTCGY